MNVQSTRRYRIGFVSDWDASNPSVMSGTSYYLRRSFQALGHEIVDIFPASKALRARMLLVPGYIAKKAYEAKGFYYSPKRNPFYVAAVSDFAERRIRNDGHLDFILSQSGVSVAGLDTKLPIFLTSDQPFELYLAGYVNRPAARFIREGNALEKAVISKVSKYIFPSLWAKNAFCQAHPDYRHIAECIPWGGNLNEEPEEASVESDIAEKSKSSAYRFLYMGSDWKRKRGEFVLQTVDVLRQNGLNVEVDIVGAGQVDVGHRSYTNVISYIDKLSSAGYSEYTRLLRQAHFLFVPSRAEAYGHVFCEAAAYGVPSLTTSVGGIPSIIKNGVNGLCLPLATTAEQFAAEIQPVLGSRQSYTTMAMAARRAYKADLSWTSFATKTLEFVSEVLGEAKPAIGESTSGYKNRHESVASRAAH